ncbi:hypothetical protein F5887DRAFT_289226 [Amanita rubescens]|nr:hypothetical protein F5887DRAFT_289226 [Amanita rubescens]
MSDDEFCFTNPINRSKGKLNRLLPIPHSDPVFKQLEQQFLDGWKHPDKEKPPVQAIFKILFSGESLEQYGQYRTRVAGTFFFNFFTKSNGNEQLLFHGTTRGCLLGEDNNSVFLCNLTDCLVCNVIRNSFDVGKCGLKNKFRRFGSGIYVTACSSKADDYSMNTSKNAAFHVLLVNRVVVGKPYKRLHNATGMTEPPSGYHSVFGEPGADLNYEETVVYSNEAIRPAYLMVYGQPPRKSLFTRLFKTPLAS